MADYYNTYTDTFCCGCTSRTYDPFYRSAKTVKQMDTNNDGMVDQKEFAASGGSQTDFNRHDLNKDGVLDAHEISIADKTAGVEIRKDLVTSMNGVARGLGAGFDGLVFEHAQVSEYLAALGGMDPSGPDGGELTSSSRVDVLVALHACDTATDDALWCGISNGARVIVTAPCCHKQVRRQLEVEDESRPRGPLDAALRHGIYRERTAEMVTDTLRSLLLEIGGYDVSVFEFVGGEHTAKNVMIAAVKRKHPRSDAELAERRAEFNAMCEQFSVREQALAVWMGEHARQPMEPPATGNSLMGAPAAAVGAGAASLAKPSRRSPRAQPPAARLPPA